MFILSYQYNAVYPFFIDTLMDSYPIFREYSLQQE